MRRPTEGCSDRSPALITRRRVLCWLLPVTGTCLSVPLSAEELQVRLSGDRIRVAAPRLHFVTGKPLERLRNGAPVPYALQLSLSFDRGGNVLLRDIERFVFSYDLWEERFAVAKLGHPRKSVSHLTAQAAEAWCVDEMVLAPTGVADRQPFWVRLEVRAEDPGEDAGLDNNEGATLSRLIEIFSRRTRSEQSRWSVESGPLRLAELRKTASRAPAGAQR